MDHLQWESNLERFNALNDCTTSSWRNSIRVLILMLRFANALDGAIKKMIFKLKRQMLKSTVTDEVLYGLRVKVQHRDWSGHGIHFRPEGLRPGEQRHAAADVGLVRGPTQTHCRRHGLSITWPAVSQWQLMRSGDDSTTWQNFVAKNSKVFNEFP